MRLRDNELVLRFGNGDTFKIYMVNLQGQTGLIKLNRPAIKLTHKPLRVGSTQNAMNHPA